MKSCEADIFPKQAYESYGMIYTEILFVLTKRQNNIAKTIFYQPEILGQNGSGPAS